MGTNQEVELELRKSNYSSSSAATGRFNLLNELDLPTLSPWSNLELKAFPPWSTP